MQAHIIRYLASALVTDDTIANIPWPSLYDQIEHS
jgi:hypothetical protein